MGSPETIIVAVRAQTAHFQAILRFACKKKSLKNLNTFEKIYANPNQRKVGFDLEIIKALSCALTT